MHEHYTMFAAYNVWANGRVYAAAGALADDDYRADKGAFFGSIHRTLNHLLATDRIWLKRFTGTGDAPTSLDIVLFDDFNDLAEARHAEDDRITRWIADLDDQALRRTISYTPVSVPVPVTQRLGPALAHLFNHQTHHRGHCHMILTSLGKPSLNLDMSSFLRDAGKPWA